MSAATTRTGLRGAHWVTVRRHRSALRTTAALLMLCAGTMGLLRWWLEVSGSGDHTSARAALKIAVDWGAGAALVVPVLVAAFVAGSVARELESGTYRMLWTQSVTPAALLAAKLLSAAAAAVVGAAVAVGVLRLGWLPVASGNDLLGWYDDGVFEGIGPVALAYALLAIGAGALAGLLVRGTLAAMSAAALAVGMVMAVMRTVRDGLWPVVTVGMPTGIEAPGLPGTARVVEEGMVSGSGTRIPLEACSSRLDAYEQCLAEHDAISQYYDIHPESHFWPLQLVETGIVLALAALAVAVAFRVLRSRHA